MDILQLQELECRILLVTFADYGYSCKHVIHMIPVCNFDTIVIHVHYNIPLLDI